MWLFADDYAAQIDRLKATYLSSRDLLHRAMKQMTARIKANGARSCVVLFNDLPSDRTETVSIWAELQDASATNVRVRDAHGDALAFQVEDVNWYELGGGVRTIRELRMLIRAHVPALGYTVIYVDPVPGTLTVPVNRPHDTALESETISMQFSEQGIVSLTDRATGAVYANLGNIIYNRIKDTGPMHYGSVEETFRISEAKMDRLVLGPLRSYFEFHGKLGIHAVTIAGHIDPHAKSVSFDSTIESAGGSGHFMAITGLPGPGKLSADVHFGVEERDISKIPYGALERRRANVFSARTGPTTRTGITG